MNRFITLAAAIVFIHTVFPQPLGADEPIELLFLESLHGLPEESGHMGKIVALAFDPDGSLFLVEESGSRLIHISGDGRYLDQAGGFGFGEGAFRGPADLCMVGFEVWVSDPPSGRVVRFDRWFAPLGPMKGAIDRGDTLKFILPLSAAQAPSGDLIILEGDRQEALHLDRSGRLISRFGGFGETDEDFISPQRVEISPDGLIAVADPGRRAVLLFDRFGSPRGYRPYPLEGKGPNGLAWQGKRIWVGGDNGIAVLASDGTVLSAWPEDKFGGPVNDLAVSSDRIAVAVANTVRIYYIETVAR